MQRSERVEPCPGCGATVPVSDGVGHAYVNASVGCWGLFGQVQADELQRFGYPQAHRIVVDAYCAQHPGDASDRRDRQSVFLHLVALCMLLERGADATRATQALRNSLQGRPDFPILKRETSPGALTVVSMVGAIDLEDYTARARAWAQAVWDSWAGSHQLIREFVDLLTSSRKR